MQGSPQSITQFLSPLTIPRIPAADRDDTDDKVGPTSVSHAIRAIARNKAPGIDGFPLEYYSTFSSQLTPRLADMYEDAL